MGVRVRVRVGSGVKVGVGTGVGVAAEVAVEGVAAVGRDVGVGSDPQAAASSAMIPADHRTKPSSDFRICMIPPI